MLSVIKTENLGKKYVIHHDKKNDRYVALRDVIADNTKTFLKRVARLFLVREKKQLKYSSKENFWALKNINIEIKRGERVGIIGRNGAGKSTLLKLLSRITAPSEGQIKIRGRITSLLEVGTGFHPELTGRENIFLNGAVLGMTKAEIKKKFDEIVAFAEVEQFLDTPVKRYSSGMYIRLAFAVAAHLESDILLVDEVLAVGDADFQKKCLNVMGDISSKERTVVFVSHNMTSIIKLCDTAIWIEKGRIRLIDSSEKTVQAYLASGSKSTTGKAVFEDPEEVKDVYVSSIALRNGHDQISSDFDVLSPIKVCVRFHCRRRFTKLRIGAVVSRYDGMTVFCTTSIDYNSIPSVFEPGTYFAQMLIPGRFLAAGEYYLSFGLSEPNIKSQDIHESGIKFRIVGNPFELERKLGFLVYPFEWKLID